MLQLEGLEAWAAKQAAGMELAARPESLSSNFDGLLRVLDALYQVRGRCQHWWGRGCGAATSVCGRMLHVCSGGFVACWLAWAANIVTLCWAVGLRPC